uniref:Uncharacterized protein n=1 Tax=Kangiella spongicola TaxID=796379 RepID=A0A318D5F3_9GAMM
MVLQKAVGLPALQDCPDKPRNFLFDLQDCPGISRNFLFNIQDCPGIVRIPAQVTLLVKRENL